MQIASRNRRDGQPVHIFAGFESLFALGGQVSLPEAFRTDYGEEDYPDIHPQSAGGGRTRKLTRRNSDEANSYFFSDFPFLSSLHGDDEDENRRGEKEERKETQA